MILSRRSRQLLALTVLGLLAGCGGGSGSARSSGGGGTGLTVAARRAHHLPPTAVRVPTLIPGAGAAPVTVRVPVLTYHRVAPVSAVGQLDLKVDPQNFVAELAALAGGGYHTITQAQLFGALYRHLALPPRPVLISVDDGYVDDVRRILPALRRFHMVATFFIITGRMTEPGFLTAEQIRQLEDAGMDVGDHTVHHVDLRLLTPVQLRDETGGSRTVLEGVLGHPVYFFAYPFGAYNDRVVAAVRAAGFTMAYTTAAGVSESSTAPLAMPRIHVGRALRPAGLLAQLGGV